MHWRKISGAKKKGGGEWLTRQDCVEGVFCGERWHLSRILIEIRRWLRVYGRGKGGFPLEETTNAKPWDRSMSYCLSKSKETSAAEGESAMGDDNEIII